jgi:deoxyadenosine/deoxycytidine kinase
MPFMKKYIIVAGNIGVGKSTLVNLLCPRLDFQPFFEPVAENPYLADFYRDMDAWSFHSQVFFLAHRLRIQQDLVRYPGSVIQDRSVYEDAEIFAHNLYRQGHISPRDFETYRVLYKTVMDFLPHPDLVVYLRASVNTLVQRVILRSRDYERSINPDYLAQLNVLYEEWISNFTLCPVLTVPADDLDYVAHPRHLDLIVQKVTEKLTGKDVVVFDPDDITQANYR